MYSKYTANMHYLPYDLLDVRGFGFVPVFIKIFFGTFYNPSTASGPPPLTQGRLFTGGASPSPTKRLPCVKGAVEHSETEGLFFAERRGQQFTTQIVATKPTVLGASPKRPPLRVWCVWQKNTGYPFGIPGINYAIYYLRIILPVRDVIFSSQMYSSSVAPLVARAVCICGVTERYDASS